MLKEGRPPTRDGEREESTHGEVVLVAYRISWKVSGFREEAPLEETGVAGGVLCLVAMQGEAVAISYPQQRICHRPSSEQTVGLGGGWQGPHQGSDPIPASFLICLQAASCYLDICMCIYIFMFLLQ